jgi:hypothetical protein
MKDAPKNSDEVTTAISTLRSGIPETSYDSVYVVQNGKFQSRC